MCGDFPRRARLVPEKRPIGKTPIPRAGGETPQAAPRGGGSPPRSMVMRLGLFFKEGRRRKLSPLWSRIVGVLVVLFAAVELYGAPFGFIDSFILRSLFVSFAITLTFICYTPIRTEPGQSENVPVLEHPACLYKPRGGSLHGDERGGTRHPLDRRRSPDARRLGGHGDLRAADAGSHAAHGGPGFARDHPRVHRL